MLRSRPTSRNVSFISAEESIRAILRLDWLYSGTGPTRRDRTMPPKRARRASSTGPSPRKRKGAAKSTVTAVPSDNVFRHYLNAFSRFLLVSFCSLGLSTVLFSLSVPITQGDLAWTSKHLDSWWHVCGFLAWRIVEIGTFWALGYDG